MASKKSNDEKLIKSKKRVKDFAEVFTPDFIVKDMCDLIPNEEWEKIETTFLEPSCGNGNFIVEILRRKYEKCKDERDGLKALASVVGVDIQQDNVNECRQRVLEQFIDRFPNSAHYTYAIAFLIISNNIICDDFLHPSPKLQDFLGIEPIKEKRRKEK